MNAQRQKGTYSEKLPCSASAVMERWEVSTVWSQLNTPSGLKPTSSAVSRRAWPTRAVCLYGCRPSDSDLTTPGFVIRRLQGLVNVRALSLVWPPHFSHQKNCSGNLPQV